MHLIFRMHVYNSFFEVLISEIKQTKIWKFSIDIFGKEMIKNQEWPNYTKYKDNIKTSIKTTAKSIRKNKKI